MSKHTDAVAHVVSVLSDAFGPDVQFELTKESDRVYTVKASADDDASIADGLAAMKLAHLRGGAVAVISDTDADEYAERSLYASDPVSARRVRRVGAGSEGAMTDEPMTEWSDPSVPVHLTRLGMLTDGHIPNREWFEESLRLSRRAVEFGKEQLAREFAESDEELQKILNDSND